MGISFIPVMYGVSSREKIHASGSPISAPKPALGFTRHSAPQSSTKTATPINQVNIAKTAS
jgi:hypothetical protein